MLQTAIDDELRFSIAATEKGLFIEIARECRESYGPGTEFYFLCGRDAAERIVNWDYGRASAFREQLKEYQLLVAPRHGAYEPPPEMRSRIHPLAMPADYDDCSATEVRTRVRDGKPWEYLVPERIVPVVQEIYGKGEAL